MDSIQGIEGAGFSSGTLAARQPQPEKHKPAANVLKILCCFAEKHT
jgi:hypothetical protein